MARFVSPTRLAGAGLALLVVVTAVLYVTPSQGYYLFLPDPAHPVDPLVSISGERNAADGGGIFFVDVRYRKARLIERLFPGLRSGSTLVPVSDLRQKGVSEELQRRADLHEMAVSQQFAAVVALRRLGYRVSAHESGVSVLSVRSGSPAASKLKPNDVIVAVDGRPVRTIDQLRHRIGRHRPGETVRLTFRRGRAVERVAVKTTADPKDPERAIIGISPAPAFFAKLPVRVRIDARGVGGPSAGLAFALDVMEELGRDVDHGYKVAATGTLALDGSVGAIGAVKQKTIGARKAGVDVFLVPTGENAREAKRYADGLRVIPVHSFPQALRVLATLPPRR